MLASQLIAHLGKLVETHGDLPVAVPELSASEYGAEYVDPDPPVLGRFDTWNGRGWDYDAHGILISG